MNNENNVFAQNIELIDIFNMQEDQSIIGADFKINEDFLDVLNIPFTDDKEFCVRAFIDKKTYNELNNEFNTKGYSEQLNPVQFIMLKIDNSTDEIVEMHDGLYNYCNDILKQKGYIIKNNFMYYNKEENIINFEVAIHENIKNTINKIKSDISDILIQHNELCFCGNNESCEKCDPNSHTNKLKQSLNNYLKSL